jgi:P27 family predicted phage terminase small subunit
MPNPRTPSKLKVLRGTDRKDRANPAEPNPPALSANAEPPEWLELSDLAKVAWNDIAPMLRAMHVLTQADVVGLSLLCDALAGYVTAKRTIGEEGAVYWTSGKAPMRRAHPAVGIAGENSKFAKAMLSEFGLTPAARSRVSAADGEKADPLAKWMTG